MAPVRLLHGPYSAETQRSKVEIAEWYNVGSKALHDGSNVAVDSSPETFKSYLKPNLLCDIESIAILEA